VKLGTKRQCQACGAKLYDLGKRPVICARCGAEVDLQRLKKKKKAAAAEAVPQPRPDAPPPRRTTPRTWSPEQTRALDRVGQWLRTGDPQVFRLFGYAGVGKTTLARHVAEGARGEVLFAAFTGKAALVMRSKGCYGASTIHSLIYDASETETGEPKFILNRDGPASKAALIVIDECSMVDEELGRDLLSFGKPILVLGDPAQLPPVKGAGFFTEAEPEVMLTEIHRQAENNPIIRLATTVRSGGEIAYGEYGETRVVRREEINAPMVLKADQVLVGLNRTRRLYNQRIRTLRGAAELMPVVGDKLVCLRNNRNKGLINGGLWRVDALRGMRNDFVKMTLASEEAPD
jgi:exodeoxyribonuclease V